MYNARIETDAGKNFFFGYEHGSVFDLEPLSGADVDLSCSQGYQQIGESVTHQSAGGITRTITGVFLGEKPDWIIKRLLHVLPIFTTGKLYYNDDFYCDIVVKKTPTIVREKNKRAKFVITLFCPLPYWLSAQQITAEAGRMEACFRIPVNYDEHQFGTRVNSTTVPATNDGDAEAPLDVTFFCTNTVSGFGLTNLITGEKLKLNTSMARGDTVHVYNRAGRIYAEKTTGGVTSDIFSAFDDDNDLFFLHIGENPLHIEAESGDTFLRAAVSFNTARMGVYGDDGGEPRTAIVRSRTLYLTCPETDALTVTDGALSITEPFSSTLEAGAEWAVNG